MCVRVCSAYEGDYVTFQNSGACKTLKQKRKQNIKIKFKLIREARITVEKDKYK